MSFEAGAAAADAPASGGGDPGATAALLEGIACTLLLAAATGIENADPGLGVMAAKRLPAAAVSSALGADAAPLPPACGGTGASESR